MRSDGRPARNDAVLQSGLATIPEGFQIGSPGDLYISRDPVATWQKLTGISTNTGWALVAGTGPRDRFDLAVNFTTPVNAPVYTVLTTLAITTISPNSFLYFLYTGTFLTLGPFAGNVAPTIRFRLNGVLLQGGVTVNMVRSLIMPITLQKSVPVTAGVQSLEVEVSKFAGIGNDLTISPVLRPDLEHASLIMREEA